MSFPPSNAFLLKNAYFDIQEEYNIFKENISKGGRIKYQEASSLNGSLVQTLLKRRGLGLEIKVFSFSVI